MRDIEYQTSPPLDSSSWTGRTWEWWFLLPGFRRPVRFMVGRLDRDALEGELVPVYGIDLGYEADRHCYGLMFYWGYWRRGLHWY